MHFPICLAYEEGPLCEKKYHQTVQAHPQARMSVFACIWTDPRGVQRIPALSASHARMCRGCGGSWDVLGDARTTNASDFPSPGVCNGQEREQGKGGSTAASGGRFFPCLWLQLAYLDSFFEASHRQVGVPSSEERLHVGWVLPQNLGGVLNALAELPKLQVAHTRV